MRHSGSDMGLLVEGEWKNKWYDTEANDGHFVRSEAKFRHWVTADGSAGPTGEGGFEAESGRYHLYVAWACPWAHRTLLYRKLKGLEDHIDISVVHWYMRENGWTFKDAPGVIADPIHDAAYLHEIYTAAVPQVSGRVTVPVLWDKKRGTIVSNESADIIRMFNRAFDGVGATGPDFCPPELEAQIDRINDRVYETLNDGVYKSGFATTQEAYEAAVRPLFDTLDWLDGMLAKRRYLLGDAITEADLRLFPTLIRFEQVYHFHFKCNLRRLRDYPNLWGYTLDLYQHPGVADTMNLDHVKKHYFGSHDTINPHGIVPLGPELDLSAPHGRGERPGAE